jgi:hypothetical protein
MKRNQIRRYALGSNSFGGAACAVLLLLNGGYSATAQNNESSTTTSEKPKDPIAMIRDEGLNHSQVMQTLSYLSDVIGPRLTGSPNLKRANEWTRDTMTSWGLTNAHLEAWGPFGRGWSMKRYSAQVIEPQDIPLISCPNAWSPGFDQPVVADVVYFDATNTADMDRFKGKLKGAIVLNGATREVRPRFEPMALRMNETNLLQLANAGVSTAPLGPGGPPIPAGQGRGAGFAGRGGTNAVAGGPGGGGRGGPGGPGGRFRGGFGLGARALAFLAREGAAVVVSPSSQGDGGTFFVAAATVPTDASGPGSFTNNPRVWSTNAPAIPPQITVALEDYNRMVRMIQQGEKLKMAVDLQVRFHNDDVMAYNTIAEIPGSDLKDEIVMIGAHMDSWHSGTGATDNGAGCAATMEAVRILTALHLQPRRTIRIGLWSGEEQGLMGSRAYVAKHFGYYTNVTASTTLRTPKDEAEEASASMNSSTNNAPTRKLVKHHEYDKVAAYFNLDNGAGKIRGVYMQGNEAVRPIFRRWLQPFSDLGADTLTLSNTGGTDHQSFDGIGLPGFQFIQDPLDYWSRTHHSNEDVYDRAPADDMKQSAVILATFIFNAANADEKLPHKPQESTARPFTLGAADR